MSVTFYMDEQVPGPLTDGLRRRGVDVLTAQGDGRGETDDEDLLDRAAELGRVLVTEDQDFLRIADQRQRAATPCVGIVFIHQQGPTIGRCVQDLEIIAKLGEPHEYANRVEYLPL